MLPENPDLTELLATAAESFKARISRLAFSVHSSLGKGYCWAEKLPSGITIMVSDTVLTEEVNIDMPETSETYFCLQFNEEIAADADPKAKRRRTEEFQSFVKLNYTLVADNFIFPANKRLRSVKFAFNKAHLYALCGKQAVEDILNNQLPLAVHSNDLEPIATEYRVMLDELWTEKIKEPLRLNYIQNRVHLLLEKYLLKLFDRQDISSKKGKRNDDETLRLMKVEALLVKDFGVPPPTIIELSRISAMSPTKLKSDFKALYGFPIYVYYQKNRMLKAKSLLVLARYTIKEVGQMVGYINLSHFANAFKKEFGYLPSDASAKDGVLVYSNR